MSEPIVSFAAPPVAEVVAGFSLSNLDPHFAPLLAAYWKEALRAEFPVLQQQPPYTPPEEFVGGRAQMASLNFQLGSGFPSPRLWASTEDGNDLLQLQPGWFARNWRRVKPDDKYSKWPERRQALLYSFEKFREYCRSESEFEPAVKQGELTYINHIPMAGFAAGLGSVGEVLNGQSALSAAFPLEQMTLQAQYIIDNHGRPAGRLHVNVSPGLDQQGRPMYVLELTARSVSDDYTLEAAFDFFDRAREVIDLSFRDLTTEAMHAEWGMS